MITAYDKLLIPGDYIVSNIGAFTTQKFVRSLLDHFLVAVEGHNHPGKTSFRVSFIQADAPLFSKKHDKTTVRAPDL